LLRHTKLKSKTGKTLFAARQTNKRRTIITARRHGSEAQAQIGARERDAKRSSFSI
jgi:hypothetical protein